MKKTYIECLRIIAIILVIYNHTRELGYTLYQYTSHTLSYYFSIFMIPVCKTAVPVFLMISGANLLGKEETYKKLFSGRFIKYLWIILFWGTLQYFRYVRTGTVTLSVRDWWNNIYSEPILETYWYLYSYLGFLMLLPLLRKIVSGMSKKDYCYLFLINCISAMLAVMGYFSGGFVNYNVFMLPAVVIYPILGFGIDYVINFGKGRKILNYGLMIILPLCFIVSVSLIYLKRTNSHEDFMNLIQCFTPIISCGIFGFVKEIDASYFYSEKIKKIVTIMGSTTFGVYLIEDLVRNQIIKLLVHINAYDFIIAILYTLLTFIAGSMVVFIMKRIPILKRII